MPRAEIWHGRAFWPSFETVGVLDQYSHYHLINCYIFVGVLVHKFDYNSLAKSAVNVKLCTIFIAPEISYYIISL